MIEQNRELQSANRIIGLLEESSLQTETIIDSIPGIFVIINENNEILRYNYAFRDFFPDEERLFRKEIPSIFSEVNWKIFEKNKQQLTEREDLTETKIEFELPISVKIQDKVIEKAVLWNLREVNSKNNSEGKLFCLLGNDISKLRETELRLSNIFQAVPLGIFTIDTDGKIEEVHSKFLSTFLRKKFVGEHLKDVLFAPIIDNLDDLTRNSIDLIFHALGQNKEFFYTHLSEFPHQIKFKPVDSDIDPIWIKIKYHPLCNNENVSKILIVLEDITDIIIAKKKEEKAYIIEKQSMALYESAIRDPLTGLYTRLYMGDSITNLLSSHDRHQVEQVSLLILDIDHFKKVNDTYGHLVGDKILKEVGQIVLSSVRSNDIPIRYGGEEFMVFISSSVKQGTVLAERIRKAVESKIFRADSLELKITISGGLASHKIGESLDVFIGRADKLLYEAKKNGRNQNIVEQSEK